MQRRLIKFCILLSVFSDSLQAVDKLERQIQLMRVERNPVEDAVAHILQSCFPHFKNILNLANLTELRSKYIFESLRNFQLPVVSVDVHQPKKVQLKEDVDAIITTSKKFKEQQFTKLDIYEKFHLFTKGLLFIINDGTHDCKWSLNHFTEAQYRQYAKTYFFCIEHKTNILILTQTPGVTWAPPVWNRSKFGKQISKHKKNGRNEEIELFIYQRYYSKDNICHDFTYDVSKNLKNYQLRMVSLGKKYNIPFFDVKLSNTLKKVFGVTPSLEILSSSEIHKLMRKNRFDILLESHIVTPSTRSEEIFSIAFPIRYYSVVIVTNNRGLMTPLEKIYNYYGYLIVISTAVILGITFVIIYFYTRNLTFAVFEILRLLINNEIYTPMKTTSLRIFFTTIFLYFLIIHGTFGGRLAKFLTRNEFRKNVETLEDLKDPRYSQIYTYQHARHYIKDPELLKKTNFHHLNCKEKIQNNASVACINDLVKLLPVIGELDLHQPKKVVHTGYYAQLVRKNSPFKNKINDLMIILMHSGLAQKWTNDKIADEMRGIKIKKARALIYYRPIDFDDLYFSFVLLGLGLLCSATSFVIELFLKKFLVREKQKRARGRWNVPKVLVKLNQKNSSNDFQVGTGGPRYCRRWRNIFRRILRSFTRYLLRHW